MAASTSLVSQQERSSVLPVLRSGTREMHEALEQKLNLEAAFASPEAYRELLARYLGLYRPFEKMIASSGRDMQQIAMLPERSRVKLLEQDLLALQLSAEEIAHIPDSKFPTSVPDRDQLLGMLYVIEGSNLGGQVISRQVERQLSFTADHGAAFFNGDATLTGTYWKRFTGLLEQNVINADQAAEGARQMFHMFDRWLA